MEEISPLVAKGHHRRIIDLKLGGHVFKKFRMRGAVIDHSENVPQSMLSPCLPLTVA